MIRCICTNQRGHIDTHTDGHRWEAHWDTTMTHIAKRTHETEETQKERTTPKAEGLRGEHRYDPQQRDTEEGHTEGDTPQNTEGKEKGDTHQRTHQRGDTHTHIRGDTSKGLSLRHTWLTPQLQISLLHFLTPVSYITSPGFLEVI